MKYLLKAAIALICLSAWAQTAETPTEYQGPQILSRGGSLSDLRLIGVVGFRYFADTNFIYDSGILPATVDPTGKLTEGNGVYGAELRAGAFGRKRWRRSIVDLTYSGSYRHYSQNTYYDGIDQVLGLTYGTQLTKRVQLQTVTNAGAISSAFGSVYGFGYVPAAAIGVPTSEIFDNRSFYLDQSAAITYQKSSRLSFTAGGHAMGVRRQSSALVGMNGYGALGSVTYRVSRPTSVFLNYDFTHVDYPKAFGESDMHTIGLGVSRMINKRWTASIQFGAIYIDTVGITQVAADPITQLLFGTTTVTEAFFRKRVYPSGSVAASGTFKRAGVGFGYSRAPSPGNGVYLASLNDSASASLSYTTTRRLSLQIAGSYNRLSSVGQVGLGNYTYANGGAGASYRLTNILSASARYDARKSQIDLTNGLNRLAYRASIGLTFSPGERPLSIW